MKKITISSGELSLAVELNDSQTAQAIWETLPIEGIANRWGEEIYFEIPVRLEQESGARAAVSVGELGYWPTGHAFCIFFGPTPASTGKEPRAYSPVNVFGKVSGDATLFKKVKDGDRVEITRS